MIKNLNSKERKEIQRILEQQFGVTLEDYHFFINDSNRVYIYNGDIELLSKMTRVDAVGLYIGEYKNGTMRLSIEGSQIIGKIATKGIFEINEEQAREWMKGNNLKIKDQTEFLIIKYCNDFLGCGKGNGEEIFNFVPKVRRTNFI